jgi:hypothetical protein
MKFLDFNFGLKGLMEYTYHSIPISESFKKEAIRQLGFKFKKDFEGILDTKKISLTFDSFNFDPIKNNETLPKFLEEQALYVAKKFGMFYGGSAMCYDGDLTIKKSDLNYESICDGDLFQLDQEILSNQYVFEFQVYDYVLPSLMKLIENIKTRKNIKILSSFIFPVKMINPGIDCEIKVRFQEKIDKESKASIINAVIEEVDKFNTTNLKDPDSKGLIHNILKIKSESTFSDNMTFVVDTGSAGEEGIKAFLKALQKSNFHVHEVEIS